MKKSTKRDITTTDTTELASKTPSKELQQIVKNAGKAAKGVYLGIKKFDQYVNEGLILGRKEGFTDMEIGDMFRAEANRLGLSRMTLSRYLPDTAKHMEKARLRLESKSGNRMLPNRSVTVSTESNTTGTTELEQEQQEEKGSPGKWNEDPLEYKIEEIEQYDINYLRQAVKALHQLRMDFIKDSFKWQTKYDDMQKENKVWKEKVLELRKLVDARETAKASPN